jgi:hypothetical protein
MPFVRMQLENSNTNMKLVEKGAECLGNLAQSGGNITAKNIEETLNKAIEWLEIKNNTDMKKYAAVLILQEFSKKLPVITFNKLFGVGKLYMKVFVTFSDTREHVRMTAAEVINSCIKHISDR